MSHSERQADRFGLPPLSELLPLGYLYLLLLGIASQSIYYGLIGINYLDYSDLLDVLISPLALVTGNPILLIALLAVSGLILPYLWLVRWALARWRPDKFRGSLLERPINQLWLTLCSVVLIFGFLGHGVGSGLSTSERIAEGRTVLDYRLSFADGTVEDVDLVGKNSGFVFFVRPGQSHVTAAPITANIRAIDKIDRDAAASAVSPGERSADSSAADRVATDEADSF